jgi:hypothetical protein
MNKPTSAGFPSRLAVTYRAVGDLISDPRNARTHSKRQIDQIRASWLSRKQERLTARA